MSAVSQPRATGDFDIEQPRFNPATIFRIKHLTHAAHGALTILALCLLAWNYLRTIGRVVLDDGTPAIVIPRPHIDPDHWETLVGGGLLLVAIVVKAVERYVRWKNQSVLIPLWGEEVGPPAGAELALGWGRPSDIGAVLRFLETAFPPRWFLARSMSDRRRTLERLLAKCPRAILMIGQKRGQRWKLIGCSLIAPLSRQTFFGYRNGRVDNWLIDSEDFQVRSPFLLSNYLFCYRRDMGGLLRDTFFTHVAAVCNEGDPGVVIVAPRKSAKGQENMRRLGGHEVGKSLQNFPLFELDLRREIELGEWARSSRRSVAEALGPSAGRLDR